MGAVFGPVVDNLVAQLSRLPGVGTRTAQRLAFHLLRVPKEEALALAQAIVEVKERIRPCRECGNLTEEELCVICSDARRDRHVICDGTVEVEAHEIRRTLGAGEVVGEISLVEEGTRRARVVTTSPVRALALGRADFDQLVEDEPRFGEAVRELARRRLEDLESS